MVAAVATEVEQVLHLAAAAGEREVAAGGEVVGAASWGRVLLQEGDGELDHPAQEVGQVLEEDEGLDAREGSQGEALPGLLGPVGLGGSEINSAHAVMMIYISACCCNYAPLSIWAVVVSARAPFNSYHTFRQQEQFDRMDKSMMDDVMVGYQEYHRLVGQGRELTALKAHVARFQKEHEQLLTDLRNRDKHQSQDEQKIKELSVNLLQMSKKVMFEEDARLDLEEKHLRREQDLLRKMEEIAKQKEQAEHTLDIQRNAIECGKQSEEKLRQQLQKARKKHEDYKSERQAEKQETMERMAELEQDNQDYEQSINQLIDRENELKAELKETIAAHQKKQQSMLQLQQQIASLKLEAEGDQAKIQQLHQQINEAKRRYEEVLAGTAEMDKNQSLLVAQVDEIKTQFMALVEQNRTVTFERNAARETIDGLSLEVNELNKKIQALELKDQASKKKMEEYEQVNEDLRFQAVVSSQQNDSLTKEKHELRIEIEELNQASFNEIQRLRKELALSTDQRENFIRKMEAIRLEMSEKNNKSHHAIDELNCQLAEMTVQKEQLLSENEELKEAARRDRETGESKEQQQEKDIKAARNQIGRLRQKQELLEQNIDKMFIQNSNLSKRLQESMSQMQQNEQLWEKQVLKISTELNQTVVDYERRLNEAIRSSQDMKQQVESLGQTLKQATQDKNEAIEEFNESERRAEEALAKFESARALVIKLQSHKKAGDEQVRKCKQRCEELQQDNQFLKELCQQIEVKSEKGSQASRKVEDVERELAIHLVKEEEQVEHLARAKQQIAKLKAALDDSSHEVEEQIERLRHIEADYDRLRQQAEYERARVADETILHDHTEVIDLGSEPTTNKKMAETRHQQLEFIRALSQEVVRYLQGKKESIRKDGMANIEQQILKGEFKNIKKEITEAVQHFMKGGE